MANEESGTKVWLVNAAEPAGEADGAKAARFRRSEAAELAANSGVLGGRESCQSRPASELECWRFIHMTIGKKKEANMMK